MEDAESSLIVGTTGSATTFASSTQIPVLHRTRTKVEREPSPWCGCRDEIDQGDKA